MDLKAELNRSTEEAQKTLAVALGNSDCTVEDARAAMLAVHDAVYDSLGSDNKLTASRMGVAVAVLNYQATMYSTLLMEGVEKELAKNVDQS